MAEHRSRTRVPIKAEGAGKIAASAKRFDFRVEDYSIAGLLLHVVKGTVPGIGEQIALAIRTARLDGGFSRFTLTANVKRHQKKRNRILCGVEVLVVNGQGVREEMNQTYLEQFFSQF